MSGATPTDLQTLIKRVERLESELAQTKAELARKNGIIEALQKRLFGSSSERLDPDQLQLLFDEVVLGKPATPPEDGGPSAPEEPKEKAARVRRKKADLYPENLKVVIEEVIIPEEVAANPEGYIEISEEHHDELDVVRAALFWRRKVRKKFQRKGERSLPPVIAPAPESSLPGTLCAPGLAAQIVVDKYCDHLPHYRQSQRMLRRHMAHIARQTLGKWTHAVAAHLTPVAEAIKGELFEAAVLQVDETPIEYLCPGHGSTKQGYLWVYLDTMSRTVCYDWQTSRSHDCLLDIIGLDEKTSTTLFEGIIQCDGYSAYQALVARYGGIRLAGCLAHIRRKFHEARSQAPEVVLPILLAIQKLYRIEKWLRKTKAPPDCRELVRLARSRPIADELHQTILGQRSAHLPQSKLGEALNYALGQWEKFRLYLENGEVEIDNNLVENAIRPTKLGAKNYLFFGSAEAGKHNAVLYTLIENCKAHDLDPEVYLAEIIKRLPTDPTPEQAAALTPRRFAEERRQAQSAA